MERDYFSIYDTTDYDSINDVWPQASLVGADLLQRDEWARSGVPGVNAVVFQFKVKPKTVLTDFLSQSNLPRNGFLVSQKVKELLVKFNLGDAPLVEATAEYKKKSFPYCWVLARHNYFEDIDFENTRFCLRNIQTSEKILSYKRLSRMDYLTKSMKLSLDNNIVPEDSVLHLKKPAALQCDLLYLPVSKHVLLVSKELRERLLSEQITGVEFSDEPVLTLKAE